MNTKKTIDCIGLLLYAVVTAFHDLCRAGERMEDEIESGVSPKDALNQYRHHRRTIMGGLMSIAESNPVFQKNEAGFQQWQQDNFGDTISNLEKRTEKIAEDARAGRITAAEGRETLANILSEFLSMAADAGQAAEGPQRLKINTDGAPKYEPLGEGLLHSLGSGLRNGDLRLYVVIAENTYGISPGEVVIEFTHDPAGDGTCINAATPDNVAYRRHIEKKACAPVEVSEGVGVEELLHPKTRQHIWGQVQAMNAKHEAEGVNVIDCNAKFTVGKPVGAEKNLRDGEATYKSERIGRDTIAEALGFGVEHFSIGGGVSLRDRKQPEASPQFSQKINDYFEARGVAPEISLAVADSNKPFQLEGKTLFRLGDFKKWWEEMHGEPLKEDEWVREAMARDAAKHLLIDPLGGRVVEAWSFETLGPVATD